jgi:hypothetical protein
MQGDVPSSPVATVAADSVTIIAVRTILTDVCDGMWDPGDGRDAKAESRRRQGRRL